VDLRKGPAVPPTLPDIATILKQQLLFSRLDERQFTRVARTAVRVELDEGELLFSQGEPATRFYVVVSGQIKLSRVSPSGGEKIIEIIHAGHSFAEALMFLDRPAYPVGATALQPSILISVDSSNYAAVLRESPDTCFLIMGDMSQRLRGLVQEIDDLTLQSAGARVAGYLLHHAGGNGADLVLDAPKQVLAARLSITPETFSRVLRRLSNRGVIAVERDLVHIRDRAKLSEAANQSFDS
jgi:CRP-like cAMP-binding protein